VKKFVCTLLCIFLLVSLGNFAIDFYKKKSGADNLLTDPKETFDASRSGFNIGTCWSLTEDAAIIVLCTDDDQSSWNSQEIEMFRGQAELAAQHLCKNAADYGVTLTLPVYVFASDENRQVRFDGTLLTGGENCDALTSIAHNWGFDDKWDLHRVMLEQIKMNQLIYVVAHNKQGYSFAQAEDWIAPEKDDFSMPEYCVIQFPGNTDESTTVLHEVLHLFGAQDFYKKEFETQSGLVVYNEDRARLAEEWFIDEVMLCRCDSMDKVKISDFTAYTIGWLDALPAQYDRAEWWVGSQWEKVYVSNQG